MSPLRKNEDLDCPVCRGSAGQMWIDERKVTLVECENCSTFTITKDCAEAFLEAWRTGDRETLMCLEQLSRYLRLGGDDCDREVTVESWLSLAIEGENFDDE